MSFQTFAADPGFPPADGRTRTTIGQWIVDYDPPTAPTIADVQAQAAPSAAQIYSALQAATAAMFQDRQSGFGRALRAIGAVVLARVNATDQTLTNLLAAIAAAASLADLKTRAAAISAPPQFTLTDVKQAITNAINSTDSD